MKKIGFLCALALFALLVLAVIRSSDNAVEIAQAKGAIEAVRAVPYASRAAQIAAEGVSGEGQGQTLILLLVTLIFTSLFILAVYHVMRRVIRLQHAYRKFISGNWVSGPNAHWRKSDESDLSRQMEIEQQWLLSHLLSQSHEDTESHDLLDLPHDWWS